MIIAALFSPDDLSGPLKCCLLALRHVISTHIPVHTLSTVKFPPLCHTNTLTAGYSVQGTTYISIADERKCSAQMCKYPNSCGMAH